MTDSYDVDLSDTALVDVIALVTWCLDDAPPTPLLVESLRAVVAPRENESQRDWIKRLGYHVEASTALATALLEMLSLKLGVSPEWFLQELAVNQAASMIEKRRGT